MRGATVAVRPELKRAGATDRGRIGRSLERSGLITRDVENAYLAFDPGEEAPINALLGASITYRIATGPREGQKVFTLQTLPVEPEAPRREVAESSGFSLHAGIAAKASQRDKLEHLSRYVARPPVATERLSLTEGGLRLRKFAAVEGFADLRCKRLRKRLQFHGREGSEWPDKIRALHTTFGCSARSYASCSSRSR
jgi:hypothetical protein